MIRWSKLWVLIAGVVLVYGAPAAAQTEQKPGEPGKVIVSIYRVAPGKHLDFLKWQGE